MEIRNKTKLPLRISLPGGKKLHLGPGGTGQVSPKAADHPPLKKLVDDDQIEIVSGGLSQGKGSSTGSTGKTPRQGPAARGGIRQTGDR